MNPIKCPNAHLVFNAIERFTANIKERRGINLQQAKFKVLAMDDLPLEIPHDMPRAGNIINDVFESGMVVYGCPICSDQFFSSIGTLEMAMSVCRSVGPCHLAF